MNLSYIDASIASRMGLKRNNFYAFLQLVVITPWLTPSWLGYLHWVVISSSLALIWVKVQQIEQYSQIVAHVI